MILLLKKIIKKKLNSRLKNNENMEFLKILREMKKSENFDSIIEK